MRVSCDLDQYADVLLPGRFRRLMVDGMRETEYLGEEAVSIQFYKPGLHTIEAFEEG